jgi:hypothetical protein
LQERFRYYYRFALLAQQNQRIPEMKNGQPI